LNLRQYVLLSAALAVLFFALPAAAQDGGWQLFYTNPAGDQFFYDQDNMTRRETGSIVGITLKVSTQKEGPGPKELITTVEIDCKKQLYRRLAWQTPGPDGSVRTTKNPSEWGYIPQGSTTDMLKEIACKGVSTRRRER
jgi:hypothetical protein